MREPCLDLNVRYHCPIFGVSNFLKPKYNSYKRKIWKYENGDYYKLRSSLSEADRNSVYNDDLDIYTQKISNVLIEKASQSIPNNTITINPHDPSWITSKIKGKKILQESEGNSDQHWLKFRRLGNKVIPSIRLAKNEYFNSMAIKLRSGNLGSRDWWKIFKSLISPTYSSGSTLPPIFDFASDRFAVDDFEKASLLDSFFCSQSEIDDSLNTLPREHPMKQ